MIKYVTGIAACAVALMVFGGCNSQPGDHDGASGSVTAAGTGHDVMYQTTPYNAMLDALYDGSMTIGALAGYGDIGIGTFNQLDGELMVLDGVTYQVRADGSVHVADDTMRTPFAVVTSFEADVTAEITSPTDFAGLTALIDSLRPTDNIFYAIRVRGEFSSLKTKSVPKQEEPYPTLAEILLVQPTFDLTDVSGEMAGFWLPSYIEGINVPGYHVHFLTDDKTAGGHVMECTIQHAVVEVDFTTGFHMILERTEAFDNADMTRSMQELQRTGQYRYLDEDE